MLSFCAPSYSVSECVSMFLDRLPPLSKPHPIRRFVKLMYKLRPIVGEIGYRPTDLFINLTFSKAFATHLKFLVIITQRCIHQTLAHAPEGRKINCNVTLDYATIIVSYQKARHEFNYFTCCWVQNLSLSLKETNYSLVGFKDDPSFWQVIEMIKYCMLKYCFHSRSPCSNICSYLNVIYESSLKLESFISSASFGSSSFGLRLGLGSWPSITCMRSSWHLCCLLSQITSTNWQMIWMTKRGILVICW